MYVYKMPQRNVERLAGENLYGLMRVIKIAELFSSVSSFYDLCPRFFYPLTFVTFYGRR